MFRELKAKKAKFGFTCGVNVQSVFVIADAVREARMEDPDLKFEITGYTSSLDAKVYTNVPKAADIMRSFMQV